MPLDVQIINQSEDLCGVLCHFFRAEGDRAVCSGLWRSECRLSGADTALSKSRPDLIIIEVTMPEANALSILNGLQKSADTTSPGNWKYFKGISTTLYAPAINLPQIGPAAFWPTTQVR